MKRALCVIVALALSVALCACGSGGSSATEPPTQATNTEGEYAVCAEQKGDFFVPVSPLIYGASL